MAATPPRILIITRNLPPLVGGMERLNWHMADELSKVADVSVIGPAGSAALAPPGVAVLEAPLKPLWKFLLRARVLARREARSWRPDIILAGSGLTAPLVRAAARTCRAKTAVYVHGLDVAVRNAVYRALWVPAIRRADRVIANSRATADLCRAVGVNPARIGIVHPGVDLPAAADPLHAPVGARPARELVGRASKPRIHSGDMTSDALAFRAHHHLGDGPLLLSVGRLSARKGLRELVTRAFPQIVAAHPNATLLIVGDAPTQALHAEAQTPASILAAARQVGVAGNLRFLGTITDYGELGCVYRAADVHVFPVRDIPGDPEGFGMVAVEAAAHGLPTVAFATGGVVDAVADGQSGYLVVAGDYAAFASAVTRVLAELGTLRTGCVAFARQFAWPAFGAGLAGELTHMIPGLADGGGTP